MFRHKHATLSWILDPLERVGGPSIQRRAHGRDVQVAGDEAAMEWTIHGLTPLGGITFTGVDVFTFDEAGRIASVRAYWERTRVTEQRERLRRLSEGSV